MANITNYKWNEVTLCNMLKNEVYIGNTVQNKKTVISYKVKKMRTVEKENQIRVNNTHEAIIDKDTFEKVQCIFDKRGTNTKLKYDYLPNGFIVHANFITLAIKFDVLVTIGDASLNVEVLLDTLTEEKYQTKAMKYPKEYKVKAITIFPYFGSENYEINGYAFIPDGSGALIRYGDVEYPDTAYIKRVYGDDLGINPSIEKEYLKEQNNITLPIYGINHGYEQAAFLCEISNGYGSSELHSYP